MTVATMDPEPRTNRGTPTGAAVRTKFVVIGGGLVGLGTALALKQHAPGAAIEVLEYRKHEARNSKHETN